MLHLQRNGSVRKMANETEIYGVVRRARNILPADIMTAKVIENTLKTVYLPTLTSRTISSSYKVAVDLLLSAFANETVLSGG